MYDKRSSRCICAQPLTISLTFHTLPHCRHRLHKKKLTFRGLDWDPEPCKYSTPFSSGCSSVSLVLFLLQLSPLPATWRQGCRKALSCTRLYILCTAFPMYFVQLACTRVQLSYDIVTFPTICLNAHLVRSCLWSLLLQQCQCQIHRLQQHHRQQHPHCSGCGQCDGCFS